MQRYLKKHLKTYGKKKVSLRKQKKGRQEKHPIETLGNAWFDDGIHTKYVLEKEETYGLHRIWYNPEKYPETPKGGYLQGYHNLDQQGDCMVLDEACAFSNAFVSGNAKLHDGAKACENAHICGNAEMWDYSCACGSSHITDNAWIAGEVIVTDNAVICKEAQLYGDVYIRGLVTRGSYERRRMTGKDLIDLIKQNNAEDLRVTLYNAMEGCYPFFDVFVSEDYENPDNFLHREDDSKPLESDKQLIILAH